MERIESHRIARILATAPVVARLGLAAPYLRCRERAAETLAEMAARRLADAEPIHDERQMILPIVG